MRAGAPIAGLAGKAVLTPGLGGRSAELECENVLVAHDAPGVGEPHRR